MTGIGTLLIQNDPWPKEPPGWRELKNRLFELCFKVRPPHRVKQIELDPLDSRLMREYIDYLNQKPDSPLLTGDFRFRGSRVVFDARETCVVAEPESRIAAWIRRIEKVADA